MSKHTNTLAYSLMLLGALLAPLPSHAANNLPVTLTLQANGQNQTLTLTPNDPLTVTLSATALPTFAPLQAMDWWILASTPAGLFSYNTQQQSFIEGINLAAQLPLINDGKNLTLLENAHLPIGHYRLYFGADLQANGAIDSSLGYTQLHIEVVETLAKTLNYKSNFASDSDGWVGGFSDLPVDADLDIYELAANYSPLPKGISGTGGAFMLQGHNRSDDLFMFAKRPLTGLKPNTSYYVVFNVTFASNAASGSVGIGGSPAESVYVKAGVSNTEPLVINKNGYWQMSVDKGEQSTGGKVLHLLGNVAVDSEDGAYQLKTLSNTAAFEFTTDSSGAAWLAVGTDSGFEGLTRLYYTEIAAAFVEKGK